MNAVWLRLRAELRHRWGRTLTLVLLVGIAGGAVLTAATGARRTASAFPRLLDAAGATDVDIIDPGFERDYEFETLVARPEVEHAVEFAIMPMFVADENGELQIEASFGFSAAAYTSERGYDAVVKPKVLDGRRPDPARADEIAVNRTFADDYDLGVGDEIEIRVPRDAEAVIAWLESGFQAAFPDYATETFRVTGIVLDISEVLPDEGNPLGAVAHTPAFFEQYERAAVGFAQGFVLHDSADVASFRAAVDDLVPEGSEVDISETAPQHDVVQRAIRPQAVALALFAVALGLMALVLVGQALHRQFSADAADHGVLRALGFDRTQLVGVGVLRAALVALGGAVLAVALALALSPLMPIGPARDAEPDPGFAVDDRALLVGAAVIVVVTVLLGAFAAWRASRFSQARARASIDQPSRVLAAVTRTRLGPAGVVGVRMALEPGRGQTAVPVRTTIVGAATAVAAVMAAVTFAASLNHLLDTPRLYGWQWDTEITVDQHTATLDDVAGAVEPVLYAHDEVAEWSRGVVSSTNIDGQTVPAVGIDPTEGDVYPTIIRGRVPERADEIALATRTLDQFDVSIGDDVRASFGDEERDLRVVGQVVLPAFLGTFEGNRTELGKGALLTRQAMIDLGPPGIGQGLYLVRFDEGTDVGAATARFEEEFADAEVTLVVNDLRRPPEIVNYDRVRSTPQTLAVFMTAAAVIALAHALFTGARRRRRDLAVLKTMGFVRRQVRATVSWQASTVAALSLLIGVPVGVAGGRWAWTLFVEQLGAVAAPVSPWLALVLAAPVALLVANVVGAIPAGIAARTRPALVLRTE